MKTASLTKTEARRQLRLPFKRPRIRFSFSGGRTSAVMVDRCLDIYLPTHDVLVLFANTGEEHEKTLEFINECDNRRNFGTIWLESVVHKEHGKGCTSRVVNYKTASRNGEPFEAVIAKYGIPNSTSPMCTDRLKTDVMAHYTEKVVGWKKGTYTTAIGIRADEADRASESATKNNLIYPLIKDGWTKDMVVEEVRSWGFDLGIPEHWGNCKWCWKKTFRKLMTLANEDPRAFDFPRRMESRYGTYKADRAAGDGNGRRHFFRGHKSVADIFEDAKRPFVPFTDKYEITEFSELDVGGSCGETCEIGG